MEFLLIPKEIPLYLLIGKDAFTHWTVEPAPVGSDQRDIHRTRDMTIFLNGLFGPFKGL